MISRARNRNTATSTDGGAGQRNGRTTKFTSVNGARMDCTALQSTMTRPARHVQLASTRTIVENAENAQKTMSLTKARTAVGIKIVLRELTMMEEKKVAHYARRGVTVVSGVPIPLEHAKPVHRENIRIYWAAPIQRTARSAQQVNQTQRQLQIPFHSASNVRLV